MRGNYIRLLVLLSAVSLSGCATLPVSGPGGAAISQAGKTGSFALVEVDSLDVVPPSASVGAGAILPSMEGNANAIAPGDVLNITIYEVGSRLFSGVSTGGGALQQFDPGARGERIAALPVDEQGNIRLPYIGSLKAAGLSITQLAGEVERRLKGKSELPQVTVMVEQANGGAVIVGGEVVRPGRVPLSGARERLLDIISLAGGYRGREVEIVVRVERKGHTSEAPLADLKYTNLGGMMMEAGDRVDLIYRPKSYSMLGVPTKVDQFPFLTSDVSLMEAIAKSGGMSDNLADPAAVFVFRFRSNGEGREEPVVYHVNMMRPLSYLIAQKFKLQDKDVVYVGTAAANRPSKLVRIISEIFTPVLLTRQLTN